MRLFAGVGESVGESWRLGGTTGVGGLATKLRSRDGEVLEMDWGVGLDVDGVIGVALEAVDGWEAG